jgi:hypothetical protein
MGIAEGALKERNDGLLDLLAIDEEMRQLEPVTMRNAVRYAELEDERQCLCEALSLMGCGPWMFGEAPWIR